jgi:hypothetical protein
MVVLVVPPPPTVVVTTDVPVVPVPPVVDVAAVPPVVVAADVFVVPPPWVDDGVADVLVVAMAKNSPRLNWPSSCSAPNSTPEGMKKIPSDGSKYEAETSSSGESPYFNGVIFQRPIPPVGNLKLATVAMTGRTWPRDGSIVRIL